MPDGPRTRVERERQEREKRAFLSVAGIGFGASLLAAIMIGHRRAHRQAIAEGESIQRRQVNWALRAFGIGTLYAFAFVGMTAAAGSYYLQTKKGISSIDEFSQLMRAKAKDKLGGFWMRKKLGIDDAKDQEAVDRVDRLISEPDEESGEKKIKFARVKKLMHRSSGGDSSPHSENNTLDADNEETDLEPKRLSVGAKMRRAFGFGKTKD
ncbi:hypothetical protein IWW48_005934 [Coemansia sp. RSA 1200]|nr:hypothetical protein IWW48_005934 [Coemansia sp. RSA 1200]